MKVPTTNGLIVALHNAGVTLDFVDHPAWLVIRWTRDNGERGAYQHEEPLPPGMPTWLAVGRRRAVAVRELIYRLLNDGHILGSAFNGCECYEVEIAREDAR